MELSRFRDLPLGEQLFVAFDTETTGLEASFHRIVEIGAVKFVLGGSAATQFQTLVNPDRPMPPEVIPIHGITDEMVAGAPKIAQALLSLSAFCEPNAILIAHNAPFDLSFVACEVDRTGVPLPNLPVLDTVEIARTCFPSQYSYSLESLTKALDLATSQEHRALADAQLVKSLFERCLATLGDISTVAELLDRFRVDQADRYTVKASNIPADLTDLQRAVEYKLRVEIQYQGSSGLTDRRVIRPYLIHERDSLLYVTAFCEKPKDDRTFRVDRIRQFRLIESEG